MFRLIRQKLKRTFWYKNLNHIFHLKDRISNHQLTSIARSIFISSKRHKQVWDVAECKVWKHRHQVLLILQPHYPREVARWPSDMKLRPLSTPAVADVRTKHRSVGRVCLQTWQPRSPLIVTMLRIVKQKMETTQKQNTVEIWQHIPMIRPT